MPPAKDATTKPAKPARRRGWRIFFTTFKWCRISVLLLVLVVIILGLFLNHVGLPDWVERRVEEQFRANGWEMKFSRLRLRWYHGIVAEDLQLQRTNATEGPHLFLQAAEFRLNWKALQHLDLEANSVLLKGGRLMWPLPGTNQPRRTLDLGQIGGELVFKPHDIWELKFIEADVLNAHVRLRGEITNASFIRDWKLPERPARPGDAPGGFWHSLLTESEKVRFTGRPELNVIFSGDARDWKSFATTLKFMALAVESPWAGGTNVTITAHLLPPPRSNDPVRIDLQAAADQARTRWVSATNVNLTLVVEPSYAHLLPAISLGLLELHGAQSGRESAERVFVEMRSSPAATNAALNETRVDVTVAGLAGRTASASRARVTATSVHSPTNFFPAEVETLGTLHDLQTAQATSRWTQVTAKLQLPAQTSPRLADTRLAWAERLRDIPITASAMLTNLAAGRLEFEQAKLKARWRFPELSFSGETALGHSPASATGAVNATTREVTFETRATPGQRDIEPFLSTNGRAWLSQLNLSSPPEARAAGRFTLPMLTNYPPDWRADVLSTLKLAGRLEAPAGSFRGVPFSAVQVPFAFTNSIWSTAGARVAQTSGGLEVSGTADQRTGDFHFHAASDFDPLSIRPAFPGEKAAIVFGFFQWAAAPRLTADGQGNWNDFARFNVTGDVVFTNTTFRGQFLKSATARVQYANQFLSIYEPLALRESEHGKAEGLGIDFALKRLYLTNATGRMLPPVVTKALGPKIDRLIEPFKFDVPPDSHVEGMVALTTEDRGDDMRFDVAGGPFHWENFHLEQVRGTVLWRGTTLTITNVVGRWRGADVSGSAHFQFTPKGRGDIFSFHARVQGADLPMVLKDFQPGKRTKVEGMVSGELFITRADTHDWKSWQGHGHAQLTNGLLWEIPIFGVFSPILNTILPGLGSSRARHATATYTITNSVIHTKDLEIRATAMRMNYRGSVDFEQQVEGTMEAALLRDLPAVGFLISKVFWPVTKLLEYEISGTLDNPKTKEQYFISRLLLMPLRPFKTLKDFLNLGEKPPQTSPGKILSE